MQDLTVTILQCELAWEDPEANLRMFDNRLDRLDQPTDLVVLPEMFTTGFSMNASELAQDMAGPSVAWMRATAERLRIDLVGSMIIIDESRYYNRLIWAKPDRTLATYDKRHLFRMSGEHETYSSGDRTVIVELKGWQICPFICYDLRFPVWTRNSKKQYDLALFVANWPAPRSVHWETLLKARAIENLCYVVGVNRVGMDGNGLPYDGKSAIIDPKGDVLFQQKDTPVMHTETLSHDVLTSYRKAFPAWMDAD